ncbi:hypothetical protein [Xenorhabdus indica]|uniref:hypothetical protein n=1 Tax=Xenorhabdus indica TaxID=333964 RepID=UPI0030B910DD
MGTTQSANFGVITFTYGFRLECFAVYASSPFIPADLRGKIITIVRGSGLTAPQQAIAVPLINGTSEQKLTGLAWIWLKFNFSSDSTTIEVADGSYASFTQLFYKI